MKITIRDKWCHIKQDPALCEASWECWSHIQSWLTESVFSCSLLWSLSYPLSSLKHCLPWRRQTKYSYLDKAKFLTIMHHSSAVWGTQALPQCVAMESVPEIFLISSKVIVTISWHVTIEYLVALSSYQHWVQIDYFSWCCFQLPPIATYIFLQSVQIMLFTFVDSAAVSEHAHKKMTIVTQDLKIN